MKKKIKKQISIFTLFGIYLKSYDYKKKKDMSQRNKSDKLNYSKRIKRIIYINYYLPPEGLTPFKYAINPGIPEEAAAGSINTKQAAKTHIAVLNN